MKTDVAYVNSGAQGHAEGLNSAVEVHVKQGILIVPYAGSWVGYFVAHQTKSRRFPDRVRSELTVAPVAAQAWIAGCIRTVEPTAGKLKNVGPPLTENWR